MKSALHILLKDLGKFWPVILLSIGVRILCYCLALSDLDAARVLSDLGPGVAKLFQMVPVLQLAIVFLLSVWVVLEDRAVGDRVAWLTRPICAREMLFAKSCFLVLAVALPAGLVSTGVAVWLHAPLNTAIIAGLSNFLFTLFAVAMIVPIAVVCATMTQTLLVTAGIFGGMMVANYIIFTLALFSLPAAPSNVSVMTNYVVAVGMMSVWAIVIMSYQYTTRRVPNTVLLAIALGFVYFGVVHWWPLNFWPEAQVIASVPPSPIAGIKLEPAAGPADFRTTERAFGESEATVLVPLHLDGLLPGRALSVTPVASALAINDGASLSNFPAKGTSYFSTFEDRFASAAALGFSTPAGALQSYVTVAGCPINQFRELQGRSGKLTATFEAVELHYEPIARLPVHVGAEAIADGHLSRIFSTQFINGACDIGFRFAWVNPILGHAQSVRPNNHYLLVNKNRGEFSEAHGAHTSGTGGPEMAFITSHSRFSETRSVHGSMVTGKVDAAWLEDAELYFFVGKEVNRTQLSFALDQVTIPTKQVTRRYIVMNPDGTRDEYER